MPAFRKRTRSGDRSASPVGDDSCANGPTSLTAVSVQADLPEGSATACSRCAVRVGENHTARPMTVSDTDRKTRMGNNMAMTLLLQT
ncbi:hypothetical protein D3C87_1652380 [compost metagenome]